MRRDVHDDYLGIVIKAADVTQENLSYSFFKTYRWINQFCRKTLDTAKLTATDPVVFHDFQLRLGAFDGDISTLLAELQEATENTMTYIAETNVFKIHETYLTQVFDVLENHHFTSVDEQPNNIAGFVHEWFDVDDVTAAQFSCQVQNASLVTLIEELQYNKPEDQPLILDLIDALRKDKGDRKKNGDFVTALVGFGKLMSITDKQNLIQIHLKRFKIKTEEKSIQISEDEGIASSSSNVSDLEAESSQPTADQPKLVKKRKLF